jgi:hypothetical protein
MQNRNPLIEDNTEETLLNIHSVLTFIRELHTDNALDENPNDKIHHIGLSLILKCTNDALYYEIDRLEKSDSDSFKTTIFEA